MTYFKIFLIVVSIIFCLGGAFNVGDTRFWFAVPFMLLLAVLSFKTNVPFGVYSFFFISICLLINLTLFKNPLIFPVLLGKVEIVKDSLYMDDQFVSSEGLHKNKMTPAQEKNLDSFLTDEKVDSVYIRDIYDISQVPIGNNRKLYKLKAGQKLDIKEIKHIGRTESEDENYIVTSLGYFDQKQINDGDIKTFSKNIQPTWTKYPGKLMYYPILLFVTPSVLSGLFRR